MILLLSLTANAHCDNQYLTAGEVAGITAGTGAFFLTGQLLKHFDSTRTSLIQGPLPLEATLQRSLGGQCGLGKRNFLDDAAGSAYTPIACGLILFAADLSLPQGDKTKTTAQDMFLYISGLMGTKAVTDISKGIFARPRPFPCLEPEMAPQRAERDWAYDHHSFFSGHTSSAFFSTTFLNIRLRSIMRSELSSEDYRDWRWASPTVLFSWASFVGWTRIQAYKHYLSDVIMGAAAGMLIAELFHSFAGDLDQSATGNGDPQMLFRLSFSF
jgi:hypothetical protein